MNTCHGEFNITDTEYKRRYAFRSKARCEQHYRVGDIRKAKSKLTGYSLGVKVRITKIAYCPEARKTKITFSIVKEHKHEVYFERL